MIPIKHHLSRKFLLTLFVLLVSAVALFMGHLEPGAWVAVSTLAITSYGAADVTEKKFIKPE